MSGAVAHIINHTHWDREWFLTAEYTSQWLPGLIDRLEALVAANPDFRFFFDGQTLVIEDLLRVAPHYAARVQALIGGGHLVVGPYYCQPDWQLSSGELLIRNLLLGQADVARYGGVTGAGWLVDTFGHIRQSPQLHQLFGLGAVYVWRGVPELIPALWWEAPDGSRLLTINLFGGYRNLYGVTHVPEVAVTRLQTEIAKLRPFYPAADIPLFDGYDLEDNPEDPVSFYRGLDGIGASIVIREATPTSFAATMRQQSATLPSLRSELNSGKYGATFPGTLSARTYLKIMAGDCERLLFGLVEPLAALAWLRGRAYDSAQYGAWSRQLLQNAVHDCLCGVSIDLVHEKMEDSYRRLFDAMLAEVRALLPPILAGFAPGVYALSTQPFAAESWQRADGRLWRVLTEGVGITPVAESYPVSTLQRAAESFAWHNDHYVAMLGQDGHVQVGPARLGQLLVFAEHGDTYSEQKGALLGALQPSGPLVIAEESEAHAILRYEAAWQGPASHVEATVHVHFDRSPLIRWQVDLDSRGADLRVEMHFATAQRGAIWAGMPFDAAPRPVADEDLLPRQLPLDLAGVLLGQRELHRVSTFPFHDFVAVGDGSASAAVFARALHAYSAGEDGTISLLLRRAVEWVTKSNLPDREGDAGPAFYVPDARCERAVRHELAFDCGKFQTSSPELLALNATFQQPPLLVRKEGSGSLHEWQLLQAPLPLSSLRLQGGQLLARLYNPAPSPAPLPASHQLVDVWGAVQGEAMEIAPYAIATLALAPQLPPDAAITDAGSVSLLNPPNWRVGPSASRPDPAILGQIARQVAALDEAIAAVQGEIEASSGAARLRLEHRYYVLKRQQLELQLSHLLNERKLAQGAGLPDPAYLYRRDEEVAALGLALNHLRIKRRIFDYVVQAV
jgi:alpha-mannosidase